MSEDHAPVKSQSPPSELRDSMNGSGVMPNHSPEGVDLTLIRWMLTLSPQERLEVLQANVQSILTLRRDPPEA